MRSEGGREDLLSANCTVQTCLRTPQSAPAAHNRDRSSRLSPASLFWLPLPRNPRTGARACRRHVTPGHAPVHFCPPSNPARSASSSTLPARRSSACGAVPSVLASTRPRHPPPRRGDSSATLTRLSSPRALCPSCVCACGGTVFIAALRTALGGCLGTQQRSRWPAGRPPRSFLGLARAPFWPAYRSSSRINPRGSHHRRRFPRRPSASALALARVCVRVTLYMPRRRPPTSSSDVPALLPIRRPASSVA